LSIDMETCIALSARNAQHEMHELYKMPEE
jgi:hypothetical protein